MGITKKITKKEFLFFLRAHQKIIALAQLIVQGNKNYDILGDSLLKETERSLKSILKSTSKGNIELEFNRITVETSEKNIFIAEEAIEIYEELPKNMKKDWLIKKI